MSADFTPSVQTATVTAGGTSEILVEASQVRSTLLVQPQTENCLINFGATAGVQATGTLTFDDNPANTETIDVNGKVFNFLTVVVDPATDIEIGADAEETRDNFIVVLNASTDAGVALATYSATTDGADPAVLVTADAGGVDGNAITLADSSSAAVTRSAATLSGGSNTEGGILLQTNTINIIDAVQYPAVKQDVYILSATNSAKIAYLEGNGA